MNRTKFISVGNLIDGSGADRRRNVVLTVRDGIITAINTAASLPRDNGAPTVDFSHCTIIPALVDCSVSLSRSPSVVSDPSPAIALADITARAATRERHIRDCHAHGVLGVADNDAAGPLKQCPGRPDEVGLVDIRSSGPPLRDMANYDPGSQDCGDFLRIAFSRDIESRNALSPRPDPEKLSRLLRHRGGKKTVMVANGRQRVEEALAAGCDAIEQGYGMGEENLRKMAKSGTLWIPTVLRAKNALDSTNDGGNVCCRFSQRYSAPGKSDPEAGAFWEKILAEQLKQLRLARELGLKTATGTGAGSLGILHGESMVEEMKLFIKAGYSLAETIRCASTNGAEFFTMKGLGPLATGKKATFLIARGTPKQLPRKLSYLEGIYINGDPSTAYNKTP